MKRFLALFLAALMLLQTMGREVLVLDYELNKARITELYCVNKARPQLKCNGKCHLAQQLRNADGADKKAPAGVVGKVKYDAVPGVALALYLPECRPLPAQRYPVWHPAPCAAVPGSGVFRPPLLQA